jgi:hypothetical protein
VKKLRPIRPSVPAAAVRPFAIAIATALAVASCSSSGGGHGTTSPSSATNSASGAAKATGCPKGSARGATSSTVTAAVSVINLSIGSLNNSTYGIPSVQDQETDWNLVADDINKSGGAGCRKIEVKFYPVNPGDPAAAQQVCLNIAAAHPYIVLDSGALTEAGYGNCIPAHKIALASEYLTKDELTKYHPYYLQIGAIPEDTIRTGTLGLKQLGYFGSAKNFKKIGVLYHTCAGSLIAAQRAALTEAGVPSSKVVSYSLGCPSTEDTPAALEQAVLSFKNAGVSAVTAIEITDFGVFTQIAKQQNFKPRYLFAENDIPTTSATKSANSPNPSNFDGAVDVLGGGYGEQTTPGFKPTAGTQKCNAIFSAAGKPEVYKQADGYGGLVCDYLWFFQALLNHTSQLKSDSLADAMKSVGTVDFSYPLAPIDFSAAPAGAAYGVSYWRAADYHASCDCWQVPDPAFHKPFA